MLFSSFILLIITTINLSFILSQNSESVLNVIQLTDANFTSFLSNTPLALVQFYAPWCGHCKKVENDYNVAAERLNDLRTQCVLARFNGGDNRQFVKSLNIKGYPSYSLFRNGVHIADYNGPRFAEDIVEYMTNKAAPPAFEVSSLTNIQEILDKTVKQHQTDTKLVVAILGIFHHDRTSEEGIDSISTYELLGNIRSAQNFLLAAELGDNRLKFMISSSKELMDYFEISLQPHEGALISLLFPPAQMNPVIKYIPIDASIETIHQEISILSAPIVVPFSPSFYREMQSSFSPTSHILVFCDSKYPLGENCLNVVKSVAPNYRGRLLFVTIPHTETHLYKTFSIEINQLPNIVAITMSSVDLYSRTIMNIPKHNELNDVNDFTEIILTNFLDNFLSGLIPPSIVSENLEPGEETKLEFIPMHKVVASNFDQLVVNTYQHFLLFVIAPWCGHCKSMEPVIRSIGRYVSGNSEFQRLISPNEEGASNVPSLRRGLFVGKIDGTKNDISYPGIIIRGYPTVLIFKKSGAGANQTVEVIPYHGERTVNHVVKFLENQDVWKVFLHENDHLIQAQYDANNRKEL